jgi:hypothetical protein
MWVTKPQGSTCSHASAGTQAAAKAAAWDPNQHTMLGYSTGARGVQGRLEQHFLPIPRPGPPIKAQLQTMARV